VTSESSPIDAVFDRTVAAHVLKHGMKYEQLAALVYQILDRDASVQHDVRLRGDDKRTAHQIDVRVRRAQQTRRTVIECRDKAPGNLVNLDEARSFATVVRQLNAQGIMLTTTGYTAGAQTLAADEGLELLALRAASEPDVTNRVSEINFFMRAVLPDPVAMRATLATTCDTPAGLRGVHLPTATVTGLPGASTMRDVVALVMDVPADATATDTPAVLSATSPRPSIFKPGEETLAIARDERVRVGP
jgi:hypothetical protein